MENFSTMSYASLFTLWVVYFVIHSLLASIWLKKVIERRWPKLLSSYRLIFNFVAIGSILIPLLYMLQIDSPWLWRWEGVWFWGMNGLALGLVGLFFSTLKYYDGAEFLGIRQLRKACDKVEDQENLKISPFHRWVRHPWYTIAIALIWTRDMNTAFFISAVMITGYFIIGSRLEERKLLEYHGAAYAKYRAKVPGILPLPWRNLSAAEAHELEAESRNGR